MSLYGPVPVTSRDGRPETLYGAGFAFGFYVRSGGAIIAYEHMTTQSDSDYSEPHDREHGAYLLIYFSAGPYARSPQVRVVSTRAVAEEVAKAVADAEPGGCHPRGSTLAYFLG